MSPHSVISHREVREGGCYFMVTLETRLDVGRDLICTFLTGLISLVWNSLQYFVPDHVIERLLKDLIDYT